MRYKFTLLFLLLPALAPAQPPSSTKGLELPAPFEADPEQGFADIEAKCEGDVKWMVLWSGKAGNVRERGNIITVAIPREGSATIVAVGIVEGKLTEFVSTRITSKTGARPPPDKPVEPKPPPTPTLPAGTKLNVNLVFDLANTTREQADIANSRELADFAAAKGHKLNRYDKSSAAVSQRKLDQVATRSGVTTPYIVILLPDGKAVPDGKALPMPKDAAGIIELLRSLVP